MSARHAITRRKNYSDQTLIAGLLADIGAPIFAAMDFPDNNPNAVKSKERVGRSFRGCLRCKYVSLVALNLLILLELRNENVMKVERPA